MGLLRKLINRQGKRVKATCSLVLVAAGSGSRMEGVHKILYPLDGIPVFIRSLIPFEQSHLIGEIIVVARQEDLEEISKLCVEYKLKKVRAVITGGESRTESVQNGLEAVSPKAELIAIHDGARPFVTQEVISQVITRAKRCSAAAPAIPVKDTIKTAKGAIIEQTLPREELFAVQTPQVFEAALIKVAIGNALKEKRIITDDCSAVEQLGVRVALTKGSEENIKVTTQMDLRFGEAILAGRISL